MNFWQLLVGMLFGGLAIASFLIAVTGTVGWIASREDMPQDRAVALRRGIVALFLLTVVLIAVGRILSGALA